MGQRLPPDGNRQHEAGGTHEEEARIGARFKDVSQTRWVTNGQTGRVVARDTSRASCG